MIRRATIEDVPRLVTMGQRFIAETSYGHVLASNPEQLTALATQLVTWPSAAILVAEGPSGLIGMIGLVAAPHFLSGQQAAGEVFWWVEPEARGVGVRLMKAAEAWAREQGAVSLQMIAPDARLEPIYERMGYVPIERTYMLTLEPYAAV